MQDSVAADRVVRTKTQRRRSQDTVPTHQTQVIISRHHHHNLQAVGHTADGNVQHRQESNDGVHKQDADMNNDDKEKQSPTEDKSHVTVSRNRETQDDEDRDSRRANTIIRSHTSFHAVTRRCF